MASISDRIASNAIEWDEKESVRTDILESGTHPAVRRSHFMYDGSVNGKRFRVEVAKKKFVNLPRAFALDPFLEYLHSDNLRKDVEFYNFRRL